MKVLITGGTGFVGAWTAKAAQDAGHEVRFLVRNVGRLSTSAEQIGSQTRNAPSVAGEFTSLLRPEDYTVAARIRCRTRAAMAARTAASTSLSSPAAKWSGTTPRRRFSSGLPSEAENAGTGSGSEVSSRGS